MARVRFVPSENLASTGRRCPSNETCIFCPIACPSAGVAHAKAARIVASMCGFMAHSIAKAEKRDFRETYKIFCKQACA